MQAPYPKLGESRHDFFLENFMTLWNYWVEEIKDVHLASSLALDCWKFIPFIGILYLYPVIVFEKYSFLLGLLITAIFSLGLYRKQVTSSRVMSAVAIFNVVLCFLAEDPASLLIYITFFLICIRHTQALIFYREAIKNEDKG